MSCNSLPAFSIVVVYYILVELSCVLTLLFKVLLLLPDPTLNYRAVKVLLERHNLSRVHYAGLNAELGMPLLLKECSDCFGIQLWFLKDPSVTWTDLAVALYNLKTEPTDNALQELKQKYLPNTG